MNAETWRILRALVQERRTCEHELAKRRGGSTNALLYWGARRKSIIDATNIIRGITHES